MERVIAGLFGVAAFAATALLCMAREVPFGACAARALAAMVAAYWIGKVLFGRLGLALAKEAAGPLPPPSAPEPAGPMASGPPGVPPKKP